MAYMAVFSVLFMYYLTLIEILWGWLLLLNWDLEMLTACSGLPSGK